MNHDATHCYDYKKSVCPKTCYRAELTEELKHINYQLPTSWAHFKATKYCPIRTSGECTSEFTCGHKVKPSTNADRIRNMDIEQLADFLCNLAYNDENPWYRPFYEKFCHNCPEPEYTLDDGRKINLHECDFVGGKCPHGTDVVWWLQQPVDGGNKDGADRD